MWCFFVRSFIVSLVMVWSVVAELSFVATAEREGKMVDMSSLEFVPMPPMRHRRHGPPSQPSDDFPSDDFPSDLVDPRHKGRRNDGGGSNSNDGYNPNPISYSGNWCGASQHVNSSDQISNAFAYFTTPDLKLRDGMSAPQFAAAWVGIDGASCRSVLLQAGVTTVVNSNGGQSAWAWWEWYPEAAYSISGLPVKPGDWMSVNITASSPKSGKIIIANLQRGYSVTLSISNGPALCRVDAEWIVEDFYDGGGQVPFASFSDVWFEETSLTTDRGRKMGLDGAAIVYLQNTTGAVTCSAAQYDRSNFVVWSR
ncbi:peptidase A4 family-domain-containing protein [Bombardia bombarda]|uniref:Peptidase A4 family-domain-containing protein n=1 Tax=Bombardia bombarda TaxID=252184 RepID=A0AA39XAC7_9PEZI|nr:peptidase A4 family-domain-containing protein [Bombardia bombarda]